MRIVLSGCLLLVACGGTEPGSGGGTEETGGGGEGTGGGEVGAADDGGGDPMQPTRAEGANFEVVVPAGYRQVVSGTIADMMREEVLDPGGVILMAAGSEVAGARPGSVVVSPTPADISSEAVDEGLCGQLAEIVAGRNASNVERASMVELPFGRTCQWELVDRADANVRRIGTIFAANAQDWIVACTYDGRDDAASEACSQVVSGWAFTD